MNKRNFLKSSAAVLATPLLGSFDLKQEQYNTPLSTFERRGSLEKSSTRLLP
jgi:hypothetical protein